MANLENTHTYTFNSAERGIESGRRWYNWGTRKQKKEKWSLLCHVGRKAVPGVLPAWGRRGGGSELAAVEFTRRKRRRPEGYPQRWIAAVLHTVKERSGEVWERKKLISPWPRVQAAACDVQREWRPTQSHRSGRVGGSTLSNSILSVPKSLRLCVCVCEGKTARKQRSNRSFQIRVCWLSSFCSPQLDPQLRHKDDELILLRAVTSVPLPLTSIWLFLSLSVHFLTLPHCLCTDSPQSTTTQWPHPRRPLFIGHWGSESE